MQRIECDVVNGPVFKTPNFVREIAPIYIGTSDGPDGRHDLYAGVDIPGKGRLATVGMDGVAHLSFEKGVVRAAGDLLGPDAFPSPCLQVAAILSDVRVPLWMLTPGNAHTVLSGTLFRAMGTHVPEGTPMKDLLAEPGREDRIFVSEDGWAYASHAYPGGPVFDIVDEEDGMAFRAIRFFPGDMHAGDDADRRRDWMAYRNFPLPFLVWLDDEEAGLDADFATGGGTIPESYTTGDKPTDEMHAYRVSRYAAYERQWLDKLEQAS